MAADSPPANDTRRAARNAGALAAANLFSKGMLFVWQFVLARWIGDAGYGIYGTVGALTIIATVIGSFGMGLIVIRDVSREPEKAGEYLTATLFMQTGLVLAAYLIMNGAAFAFGYSANIQVFVALAGIGLIIDIYGNMCSDQLLAQERMVVTSVIEAVHIVLRIGLVALVLWQGFDLLGLYAIGLAASMVRSVLFWQALARTDVNPVFPVNWMIATPLFLNSVPLALSAIFTLAYQQADKLMSTRFVGESSTGYLTAAFVIITGVVELLNSTVLIATYPIMSRYYADARDVFGFIIEKLVFFTAIVTLPVCLVLSVFAAEITIPLFGADFSPTAAVLRVLIWYALVTMAVNIFAQGMMVQNRQRRLLFIRMGGLMLNLTLNLILLMALDLGVMGIVYASVIAETLVLVVMLLTFRDEGIETRRLSGKLVRPLLIGLIVVVVMLVTGRIHFAVGVLCGGIVYLVSLLYGSVFADDDLDLIYRLLAAMPGGGYVLRYWQRDVSINW
ncbi:MAG: oligosaccharide flippase family protein [Chloroflexota bacterium]